MQAKNTSLKVSDAEEGVCGNGAGRKTERKRRFRPFVLRFIGEVARESRVDASAIHEPLELPQIAAIGAKIFCLHLTILMDKW